MVEPSMVPDIIVSVVEVSIEVIVDITDSLVAVADAVLVVALEVFSGGTSLAELEASVVLGELEAAEDWHTVSEPLI